jgi:hypothetical protein
LLAEAADQVLVGFDGDHGVRVVGREADGVRAGDGDADRRGLAGQVVQLRALDLEVPALVADVLPGEELPDDLDGFLQAFVPDPRNRPAAPGDVLLRFSPAPRPRVNRPLDSTPTVAACCATTAGW